jgi:hypothetical protein
MSETVKERRSTRHLTEQFKKFNAEKLSQVTGIPFNEDQAYAIFRTAMKNPMRFLAATVGQEEADEDGNKAFSAPGLGKFKLRNTKPAGAKFGLVGEDGQYPRYKFYPGNAIEVEMECLHNIADDIGKKYYEKMLKSEEKMADRTRKSISKLLTAVSPSGVVGEAVASSVVGEAVASSVAGNGGLGNALESFVSQIVQSTIEAYAGRPGNGGSSGGSKKKEKQDEAFVPPSVGETEAANVLDESKNEDTDLSVIEKNVLDESKNEDTVIFDTDEDDVLTSFDFNFDEDE